MGPFPHDAPAAQISEHNPAGTDGFEFVEYSHPEPQKLHALFYLMGFSPVARHKTKAATLYRQGDVNYLVNEEPGSHGANFSQKHGPSAPSMAFRVVDAAHAFKRCLELGAESVDPSDGATILDVPAIRGIGGSLIYFVDRYGQKGSPYEASFDWLGRSDPKPQGVGLFYLDHLTHNVRRGRMDVWTEFYARLFNFRQIRYFDIEGKVTGLFSKAMTSPDGKIRIPLNESQDDKSQIEEFLRDYKGEGIQHIALGTGDIYTTVDRMRAHGVKFQDTPETYYDAVDARVPGHEEALESLRSRRILIDGAPTQGQGVLLQIFTQNVVGPCFFEIIQRKGNEGFGEGNFKALFESLELDQIRRGVLSADSRAVKGA
jgi:4-hydroxyphenylpyruvate dioxygenase